MDLTAGLSSLQSECELGDLVNQRRHLSLSACAHGLFFCNLLLYTRHPERARWIHGPAPRSPPTSGGAGLRVGIIGAGQLGRQLALCLIDRSGLQVKEIRISTRRPETLGDLQQRGVICTYDNPGLASWAHVLFLCCLPSQLPNLCTEIRDYVRETCIVYSLVSAVPLSRLTRLLGHTGVVRPQYRATSAETTWEWAENCSGPAALRDPQLLTNPRDLKGAVCIASRFLETSLYAALNTCRELGLCHKQSLSTLNAMLRDAGTWSETLHVPPLRTEDVVSAEFAASLAEGSMFPWFDLSAVQMKETPLSRHVARAPRLQETLALLYSAVVGISLRVIHATDVEERTLLLTS